jgi:transcriptional regulator with XRE-family HTH domain
MPRKVRTHIMTDTTSDLRLAPRHHSKQEFGKRLRRLMLGKGWNQSELARQSNLPRDSISVYIRGRSLPTPSSLQGLSTALGLSTEELLPNQIEGAIDEDMPSLEFRVSSSDPRRGWLQVNRLVTVRAAVRIVEILENDNAVDRSGGGDPAPVQPGQG